MYKLFFFLYFSSSLFLFANDKVEIYASHIESKQKLIFANGEINVIYKDYIISASKATYNKSSGDLELFDNIALSSSNHYQILGSYAKINLLNKEKIFKPFYILDKSSDMWISANEGNTSTEHINVKNGIVSGCDQNNPLWKMEFQSSTYNTQTKWVNLYNATFYLYDIPLIYTPYFGYSLSTQRKTGLLLPSFGISDNEGIYYQQPIFIAPYNRWDIEINPQLRTQRGKGIYSTFRFVDTKESKGSLKIGYFKENKSYFSQQNLYNQEHYGYNFTYKNQNFLKTFFNYKTNSQSGLYINLESMNDVDYINLEKNNNITSDTATQVVSNINIFNNTEDNYIALYLKYNQDLTTQNNEDTLHKLPTLHYHSYLDTLLKNHLHYNIDIKATNIQNKKRTQNKTAQQTNIALPLTFYTSIFDEYLNLSYSANLYAQATKFDVLGLEETNEAIYENGIYATNTHEFKISTEIAKKYSKFNHVISFSSSYQLNGSEIRDGYYNKNEDFCENPQNINDPQCNFYNINKSNDILSLEFTQYLYNHRNKEILYHRLAQNISFENDKNIYGELENELEYSLTSSIKFYNNMFFNYDEKAFSKVFNKLTLEDKKITFGLSHLYKNLFIEEKSYTSYLTSSILYDYNDYYSYKFRYDYDLENKIKKSREIGFFYEKRCWKFGLSYLENNRPTLTQDEKTSIYDKYIYITVVLKPIMSPDSKSSAFGILLPK